jgi:NitT/TauT family transport system substrate-binding protein
MKRIVTFALAALAASASGALAQETLKATVGQRGFWDTAPIEIGTKAGIFKKHGIAVEVLYTSGSGETLQPVLTGAVDIGVAVGMAGALGAFVKGAPVRIIGAEATGAADFWYALASSPIKTLQDTEGKTIAYSTNGSSTHSIVLAFIRQYGLKVKPTATGGSPATLTQVMSGQVDVGWSSPPFGFKELDEGKIRILVRANEVPLVRDTTVRLIVANADALAKRPEAFAKFMRAYDPCAGADLTIGQLEHMATMPSRKKRTQELDSLAFSFRG